MKRHSKDRRRSVDVLSVWKCPRCRTTNNRSDLRCSTCRRVRPDGVNFKSLRVVYNEDESI